LNKETTKLKLLQGVGKILRRMVLKSAVQQIPCKVGVDKKLIYDYFAKKI
jgi:hypothetical protein